MKKITLIILLYPLLIFGQGRFSGNLSDASALCKIRASSVNAFSSNLDAEKALKRILDVTGMAKRFVLYPCNGTPNAEAITFRGVRYIFYNVNWMRSVSNQSANNWSNISILAHEVGHHINGHALDWLSYETGKIGGITLSEKRKQEIEADEFSGFVMQKLGASLYQAQSAVNKFASSGDDSYSTHPSKEKRLAAIKTGYNKAKSNNIIKTKALTAQDYLYKAINAHEFSYQFKIDNYTLCIKYSKDQKEKWLAYDGRGDAKMGLKNYYGAIADYSEAIALNPNESFFAYHNRGYLKQELNDHYGAMHDFSKAIRITEILEIGFAAGETYYNRGVSKALLNNYVEAIYDFSRAIKIKPNYTNAYFNRGLAAYRLSQRGKRVKGYSGYCSDFSKACNLGNTQACQNYYKLRCH